MVNQVRSVSPNFLRSGPHAPRSDASMVAQLEAHKARETAFMFRREGKSCSRWRNGGLNDSMHWLECLTSFVDTPYVLELFNLTGRRLVDHQLERYLLITHVRYSMILLGHGQALIVGYTE